MTNFTCFRLGQKSGDVECQGVFRVLRIADIQMIKKILSTSDEKQII